jgi:hypothetical protein
MDFPDLQEVFDARRKFVQSLTVFVGITGIFAGLYAINPVFYKKMLAEDRPVEYATAILLFSAGLFAFAAARTLYRQSRIVHWFLWLAFVFGIFGGLEEISFGQRLLHFDTPQYFLEHSSQKEVNIHNVLQKAAGEAHLRIDTTKAVLGLGMIVYGVLMPLLYFIPVVRRWMGSLRILVPPWWLFPGFIIGALFTRDRPTGEEEELAELFCSLCLAWWLGDVRKAVLAPPPVDGSRSTTLPPRVVSPAR